MFIKKVLIPLANHVLFYPQIKNCTENLNFNFERIKEKLQKHVNALANIPRYTRNINGLNEAAKYIENEWKEMEVPVRLQTFKGPEGDPNEYKNLIVSFGPENAPGIVLGAHYDSDSHSQTPGADDNASGIAGILEVTRLLKELKPTLNKKITVVAYTNEEWPHCALSYKDHKKYIPYMGSYVHAKSLKEENAPLTGAIILEMIGYYSDKKNSQSYPINALKLFYPTKGDFIGVIGNLQSFDLIQKVKTGLKQNSSIKVRAISVPKSLLPDIGRSDHDSYNEFGFNALMINNTANFRNPNYHKVTDTPDTLDYDKMVEVVKGVYGTINSL